VVAYKLYKFIFICKYKVFNVFQFQIGTNKKTTQNEIYQAFQTLNE